MMVHVNALALPICVHSNSYNAVRSQYSRHTCGVGTKLLPSQLSYETCNVAKDFLLACVLQVTPRYWWC